MITAGVDVGSLTAKSVVWDQVNGQVLGRALVHLAHEPARAGAMAFAQACEHAALTACDLTAVTATGYGRGAVENANYRITEISCHARGVHHLLPTVRTVVDIGGQDSKVIRLDDAGRALDFEMNDRCAAGTGRFLEVMASALGSELEGLAGLALRATAPASLSSTCTVFAESEVIGLVAQGTAPADLAAGLCQAVARRVGGMVQRLGLEPPVAFTGGVALNAGMRQALERVLGVPICVPSEPQMTGALGAALLAAERTTSAA